MKLQQKLAINFLRSQIALLSLISKKKAAAKAFEIFCTTNGKRNYKPTELFAAAGQLQFTFDNLKIKGYRWNVGRPKKILILHGFSSHALNFEHFVKKFIEKNYEVLIFDAPAHGLSEGKTTTGFQYKKLIQEIISKFGPVTYFLAHSFGCLATAMAIAELPDNKHVKMVFVAPAANTLSLSKMFFRQMKIKDEKLQQLFLQKIETIGGKDISWFSIKRCLKTISSELLWIHDLQDRVTPADDALEIEQLNHPNIKFIFTQGLGHRKIYRNEKIVKNVVDFL